ncbi:MULTISPECIES: pentapeptide repeat-containing protein [Pseudomonas]|uniref:pentapeptide repeat-containing protein n=1 Tax=Pseudomonas TaxID=286 RepID=UPI000B282F87|nr:MULTISPECIES: pentapeptide repeat-containing protein [Pseudomonas]
MSDRIPSKTLSGIEQDGLVLPEKTLFKNEFIGATKLKNSTLSYPIFDNCLLENCEFEKTDFSNSRFFNTTTVVQCTFSNVDFRATGLSDSRFENCTFLKCDFRQTALVDCHFSNCTFSQCKIIDNSLNAKKMTHVKFAGKLQEVSFISDQPNTPLLVDFELCKLDYVTFQNCDLESIVPPTDAQHIFFKDVSARAKKALDHLSSQPDSPINKLLKRRLQKLTTQRGALFNIKNLESYEGLEFSSLFISHLKGSE